jgi:hypothetical protein
VHSRLCTPARLFGVLICFVAKVQKTIYAEIRTEFLSYIVMLRDLEE